MITLGKFLIEDVLPFVGPGAPKKEYRVEDISYKVKMNSLRYQVFMKTLSCVTCSLQGSIFLLQYSPFNEAKVKTRIGNCFVENCEICFYKHQAMSHRRPEGWEKPHFNLYHVGKHGGLVLMTKDHILPKSKGGPDHIDNLQTMCSPCNGKKGNLYIPSEEFI